MIILKIGYARVSSLDQNLDRQLDSLKKAGCQQIFQEKISGKNTERPELQKMLAFIRSEDILIISSLDRLGRNSNDIKNILTKIQQKGASVDILDLPSFNGVSDPNLRSLLTNLVVELMSYVAQSEREKIRQRQREGIEIAKKKGVYIGKQQEYSAHAADPQKRAIYHAVVRALKEQESVLSISKKYGLARATVYRIKSELS
ncbi:recombinase family protein [Bombilactobacillus bombi]|uniref:recombinase family protein n=1 Tax=Bombilactobacillus bombi TaxID=1303590 RepID=UPI0035E79D63